IPGRKRRRSPKRDLAFSALISGAGLEALTKAIKTICQEGHLLSLEEWRRPENPVNGPDRALPLPKYVDTRPNGQRVAREGWRFDPVARAPQESVPRAPHKHEQRMRFRKELQKLRDAGNHALADQCEALYNEVQRERRSDAGRPLPVVIKSAPAAQPPKDEVP